MDIAGVATSLNQAQLINDMGVAMLSKSLDTADNLGAGLVNMIFPTSSFLKAVIARAMAR